MTDERRGSINGPLGDHPTSLVEFLTARLDEIEAAMRVKMTSRRMIAGKMMDFPIRENPRAWALPPSFVLADVEAKRQIIKRETSGRVVDQGAPEHTFTKSPTQDDEAWMERWTQPIVDTPVLRMLALPYADHPDYRLEWRI